MLDTAAMDRLRAFEEIVLRLNRRQNLVARGDEEHFWDRHIRHCLSLAVRPFPEGAQVVDWGTGGGLPAVPLAIAMPEVKVTAVDAAQKKVWAVRMMARELELDNLATWCGRAEEFPGAATHSVSRATTSLTVLWQWHVRIANAGGRTPEGAWAPGLICLKGGDLSCDRAALLRAHEDVGIAVHPLDYMGPWYCGKVIIQVCQEG